MRSICFAAALLSLAPLAASDELPQAYPAVDASAVFKQRMVRDYHMPSDDIGLPKHWPSFAKLARVNARIGRSIADAAERPAWLPGDFFGETFGRKAP